MDRAAATVLLIFHPVLVDTVIRTGTERMTSWQLLPDIPSTAFLTRGHRAAHRCGRCAVATRDGRPGDARRAGGSCGAASASAGPTWSASCRCSSTRVVRRRAARPGGCRCAGGCRSRVPMLGCLVLEMVLAQWAHGDPLARLKVDAEHGSAPLSPTHPHRRAAAVPADRRGLPADGRGAVDVRADGARRAAAYAGGHTCCMLGWFVAMWLPLTLVSGLLDPGFIRINASLMRYWVPILPALCLGAAGPRSGGSWPGYATACPGAGEAPAVR